MASDIRLPLITVTDILERNVAAELAEKTSEVRYPVVYVYCEKVVNDLREKFRTFSGTADLCVDIRVSHEHMDELQPSLQAYVEAVTDVLDKRRGSWTEEYSTRAATRFSSARSSESAGTSCSRPK